jgi:hypothetical protein
MAANSMLRNETAELRRQLAVANKTGEVHRLSQQPAYSAFHSSCGAACGAN